MNDKGKQAVARAVRRAVNEAVANGEIDPDDGLAVLIGEAATMIGRCKDPELRQAFTQHVLSTLPAAVDYVAGNKQALQRYEPLSQRVQ